MGSVAEFSVYTWSIFLSLPQTHLISIIKLSPTLQSSHTALLSRTLLGRLFLATFLSHCVTATAAAAVTLVMKDKQSDAAANLVYAMGGTL